MLLSLLLGTAITSLCLVLQSLALVAALRYFIRRANHLHATFLHAEKVIIGLLVILIFGSLGQIGIWALLFFILGEFDNLKTAFYHSAVNFATLGYGDVVMSQQHRLLGPLEAINGALMIGVSTAALARAFTTAIREQVNPKSKHDPNRWK
ncbi:ion channel [Microbulbifer bruguierae]|uniref:Ion channel n=1 Tax=Microbulbifer bruguierae TaxID=3029061 RepID=A0ABY8NC38_9GAMM|nr:potassium channel family protein [Microbulbifer bruguierae]WGL15969.1 ion channel [Microbulbifer bruguierae]